MIGDLSRYIRRQAPGMPIGLYLTGSSCAGGLRPDSDIDLLLITAHSLMPNERRDVVNYVLRHSGRRATVRPGRPIELTSLVLDDISPWRYPAICDFLYGEWLRDEYEAGDLPQREVDPNLPVILAGARQHARPLFGRPLADLIGPIPREDVTRSLLDALPALLGDLHGDERNVLLTLTRMIYTLQTGQIAPKDEAAEHVLTDLPVTHRAVVRLAADAYRGDVDDDWTGLQPQASATARFLADRVESGGATGA